MNDGRKKLYDDTKISGSYNNTIESNSSIDSDSEISDVLGLSEYEKRILGIGPKTDLQNTYDCDIEVNIDKTIRYNKEYITEEDYGFE